MSVTIPNDCAHTFSPTHRHVNIGLVTSFYSDYWTELGPGEGRGADWAESGLMVWEKDWKRNEDWEMNGQRRGYCGIAEKETCRGGRPQIHGFDICVLLDSLLAAHFSCPLHAYPPPLSPSLTISPIGRLWMRERRCGREHGTKQIPFPWTLCCARQAGTRLRMKGRLM